MAEQMTYPGIENDKAALSANPDLAAVIARRTEREEEFGVWVATQDIPWGTVLAATPGTPIPKSTVERLKWDELGLVAKRDSKAGREVLERTGLGSTEEQARWAEQDKAAAKAERERAAAAKDADSKGAEPTGDQVAVSAPPETPSRGRSGKSGGN